MPLRSTGGAGGGGGGALGASCTTGGAATTAGFGVKTGTGAAATGSGLSPGSENLRFLVSTTTDLVRPCEKFWRTVPCSMPGRFSVKVFFGVTLNVLSSPDFVSFIPYPLRHHLRQQRPQALPDRPGYRPDIGRAQPCDSGPPYQQIHRGRQHVSHLYPPMPSSTRPRRKVCRQGWKGRRYGRSPAAPG